MKILLVSIALALIAIPLATVIVPSSATAGLVQCGVDLNQDGKIDPAAAHPTTGKIAAGEKYCGICDIFNLLTNIINQVLFLYVPLIAPIFLIIGGFYILTAAGSPQRQSQGKSVITAVVIGLLITYTAWVAISTILTFLGVFAWTGLGDWWVIPGC